MAIVRLLQQESISSFPPVLLAKPGGQKNKKKKEKKIKDTPPHVFFHNTFFIIILTPNFLRWGYISRCCTGNTIFLAKKAPGSPRIRFEPNRNCFPRNGIP